MSRIKLSTAQAMRYSRQILLSGFDLEKQEKLLNAKALLIGVGGLGCAAAQYLVAAGIGQITLVDDDVVETTNLQRQILHFESNIGQKKVTSAAASLKNINHCVNISTIDKKLGPNALSKKIQQHDVVLDCSDNLATRNLINEACYAHSTPLVSGAAIRMEGQIFCVVPKLMSACYACISHYFGEQSLSCMESGIMSPVVGVVGATQAIESIKILTEYGQPNINQLQVYDALMSRWEIFGVKPYKHCNTCA